MKDIYIVTVTMTIKSFTKVVGAYSSRESAQKAIDEAKKIDRKERGGYAADALYYYTITRVPLIEEEES